MARQLEDQIGAALPDHAASEALDGASKPKVSILVVVYNGKEFILDCLASIAGGVVKNSYEVIVIDNGVDGSEALIRSDYPHAKIVSSEGNIGFAGGNNRIAAQARGEFVLLLNPDTVVRPGAIDALLDATESLPEGDAWGGLTLSPQGVPDDTNALFLPTLGKLFRGAIAPTSGKRPIILDRPHRADVVSGGYVLVRTSAWRSIGGMDEGFFLYSEEIDFFYRLKQHGFVTWKVPESIVVHDRGGGTVMSSSRLFFMTAGLAHYVRKHWSPPKAAAALLLIWFTSANRWLTGVTLGRFVRRFAALSVYQPVALRPWSWWRGYHSPGADPRLRRGRG